VKKGRQTVYNRTAAKAKQWAEKFGGGPRRTPKSAAEGQDFVTWHAWSVERHRITACTVAALPQAKP
jgi:hypothetical protein